jgi:hypothetical protein
MSVSQWGGLLVATVSLGLMASGLSGTAHADKDQRNVIVPAAQGPAEAPPAAVPPQSLGSPGGRPVAAEPAAGVVAGRLGGLGAFMPAQAQRYG